MSGTLALPTTPRNYSPSIRPTQLLRVKLEPFLLGVSEISEAQQSGPSITSQEIIHIFLSQFSEKQKISETSRNGVQLARTKHPRCIIIFILYIYIYYNGRSTKSMPLALSGIFREASRECNGSPCKMPVQKSPSRTRTFNSTYDGPCAGMPVCPCLTRRLHSYEGPVPVLEFSDQLLHYTGT